MVLESGQPMMEKDGILIQHPLVKYSLCSDIYTKRFETNILPHVPQSVNSYFLHLFYQNLITTETFAYVNERISAELVSPPLPWKPFYSQVGLCLKFKYLMPNLSFSTFNVSLNKTVGESRLLWSLSGFHGYEWQPARVPWQAQDNTKVGCNEVVLT